MSGVLQDDRSSGTGSGEINIPGAPAAALSPDRFEKLKILGAGTFGEAWLVCSKASGRQYVIKEQKFSPIVDSTDREKAMNEVRIISKCSHVNIIRYKEYFSAPAPGGCLVLSIVMEYADAGDLHAHIKRQRDVKKTYFNEPQVRQWIVQVAFALDYLHKNKILHRDVKTQNIFMIKSGLVKLGDFGISVALSAEKDWATTGIGTPQYLSPEICRSEKYNSKSDIWGLGCVLYEMCSLRPAFPIGDLRLLIETITRGRYQPVPNVFSNHLSELIKVMLRPDPSRRVSAEQVLGSKVLEEDVFRYMQFIKSMPGGVGRAPDTARKGSTSSVGSSEFSTGASETLV